MNMDIKFFSKGGRQVNTLQIYKDIDTLNQVGGYSEEASRKSYSMSQNEEILNQQKPKMRQFSPER